MGLLGLLASVGRIGDSCGQEGFCSNPFCMLIAPILESECSAYNQSCCDYLPLGLLQYSIDVATYEISKISSEHGGMSSYVHITVCSWTVLVSSKPPDAIQVVDYYLYVQFLPNTYNTLQARFWGLPFSDCFC